MLPAGKSRTLHWTKEEDAIVNQALMENSNSTYTRWSDLANKLPGRKRSGRQIRDRWNNYLNPTLSQLPFMPEDDLKVWNGYKELGPRWVEIGIQKFASTRSENQIKNRWNSVGFKKFVAKEFGVDAYENAKRGVPRTTSQRESSKEEGVVVSREGLTVKTDKQTVGRKRRVFVSASPTNSVDNSILYFNEEVTETQINANARWQKKWAGMVDEVKDQKVIVVHEAFASSSSESIKAGGNEHHQPLEAVETDRVNAITLPSKKRKPSPIWTKREENLVSRTVMSNQYSPYSSWSDLAILLPGRTSKQIRDRWTNYLDPALDRRPFSLEDDMMLWNAHRELGNRWVDIGTKKFASKRSENQIKNRWYSVGFKKFVAKEFGAGAYGTRMHRRHSPDPSP